MENKKDINYEILLGEWDNDEFKVNKVARRVLINESQFEIIKQLSDQRKDKYMDTVYKINMLEFLVGIEIDFDIKNALK